MKFSGLVVGLIFGIVALSCKSNKDKCSECPTFSKWGASEQKQMEY